MISVKNAVPHHESDFTLKELTKKLEKCGTTVRITKFNLYQKSQRYAIDMR
jgi:hypothetical protein